MQTIFSNMKCREIILSNANENWYNILSIISQLLVEMQQDTYSTIL